MKSRRGSKVKLQFAVELTMEWIFEASVFKLQFVVRRTLNFDLVEAWDSKL